MKFSSENLNKHAKRDVPLCRANITSSEIESVVEVLKSGWITTGSRAQALEDKFCDLTGARFAVALSSATAGMHLALLALNIGPGDEVITPSMTWVSTVNMIELLGAKPIFVDIDRESLTVSLDDIKPYVTNRTKAIIPVHFAGATVDIQQIRKFAIDKNIIVIEDAAHALGSKNNGQLIGAEGTAIFSLHPIKNVTSGEGGVFVTDDEAMADHVKRLKFHGLGVDAFDRKTQGRSPNAEVLEPGFKYNLPDMNATLALGQLDRLDWINAQRAKYAERYLAGLDNIAALTPLGFPVSTTLHSWHLMIIRFDIETAGFSRDEFIIKMKEKGIGLGLHFKAVHKHKYYAEKYTSLNHLFNTEWNSERIASLPLFPDMSNDDVDYVLDMTSHILS